MPDDLTRGGANAFQICLGPDFNRLPYTVRRAHVGAIKLSGHVRVQRGGAIARLLAELIALPRAGESVEMSVEGEHHADRMIWDRRFGDRQFRSCLTRDGDGLAESMGPLRLHLRLAVREGRVHYVLERVSLLGLHWPRAFAPSLEAWEGERDDHYAFAVEVRLPLVGRLVRYEGVLDHV